MVSPQLFLFLGAEQSFRCHALQLCASDRSRRGGSNPMAMAKAVVRSYHWVPLFNHFLYVLYIYCTKHMWVLFGLIQKKHKMDSFVLKLMSCFKVFVSPSSVILPDPFDHRLRPALAAHLCGRTGRGYPGGLQTVLPGQLSGAENLWGTSGAKLKRGVGL